MIKKRVEWFSEINRKYAKTQEAFRKDRNCNNIVVRVVQHIQEGWNHDKTTALLVFDFENHGQLKQSGIKYWYVRC